MSDFLIFKCSTLLFLVFLSGTVAIADSQDLQKKSDRQRLSEQLSEMARSGKIKNSESSVFSSYRKDSTYRSSKYFSEKYPSHANVRDQNLTTEAAITLRHDGSVEDVKIIRSSGSSTFDNSIISLAKNTPYQPFPDELRQKTDLFTFIVNYKIGQLINIKNPIDLGLGIEIRQNDSIKTAELHGGTHHIDLYNSPFSIIVSGNEKAIPVKICLSRTADIFNQITRSNRTKDTSCFKHTGMALSVNDSINGWTLYNRNGNGFNYFSKDMTINRDTDQIIKVKMIETLDDVKFSEIELVYMIIFMDNNQNEIIDVEEYENFTIKLHS